MKILYLYPRDYYERKMSAGRALYGRAVQRQPGIDLKFWGPGWDDYDARHTLSENMRRCGLSADVAWFYKTAPEMRSEQFKGMRVITFNEAHATKTIEEIRACNANLVLFHHQNDMRRWPMLESEGRKIGYLPHGAEVPLFDPPGNRPIDCLMTGVSAPAVYPLRERLKRLVLDGKIPGEIRPHPGYRLNGHDRVMRQYANYAAHLGRAKISLCCTSVHGYLLAKIIESLMSGAVPVTDCPDDDRFREELWPHCIQIDQGMSDRKIAQTVNEHLAHPKGLQRMSASGRAVALKGWTTDHYAARFVELCREAMA